jgi:DNA-binding Xre family transcriptional regulator
MTAKKNEKPGQLICHVPELLKKRDWRPWNLYQHSKLSWPTALKIGKGGLPGTTNTMIELCRVLDAQPGDILSYKS